MNHDKDKTALLEALKAHSDASVRLKDQQLALEDLERDHRHEETAQRNLVIQAEKDYDAACKVLAKVTPKINPFPTLNHYNAAGANNA